MKDFLWKFKLIGLILMNNYWEAITLILAQSGVEIDIDNPKGENSELQKVTFLFD